ncbi:MAG: response regulator [Bacteroidales bacterium]|nr:MAG: response regulator [Bacteroidales bacterium]
MEESGYKSDTKSVPKVLIAEDDELGIYTFKVMLKHKYNIIFAKNGREAVDKYFEENPDIVLMDIIMPEVNGYEAFDEICRRRKSNDVKIIAVTAHAMMSEKKRILAHGFDDYISKPVDDDELVEKIKKHIRR